MREHNNIDLLFEDFFDSIRQTEFCALVVLGTSGGTMDNFHQYSQQLKKELNPDLDEYYITNIIVKTLK